MPYHENYEEFFANAKEINIDGIEYLVEDVYNFFLERILAECDVIERWRKIDCTDIDV